MNLPIPNFSLVYEDRIAGSAHPGIGRRLLDTLDVLRQNNFSAIVSLTESPLEEPLLNEFGIDYLHVPVIDFTPPTVDQIVECIRFMEDRIARDQGVLVHCTAGQGRTGTILASFLVAKGLKPAEAIRNLRQLRPGSIETREQEDAVYAYDRHLKESSK